MLSTCWFHTGDAALKVLQVKAQELLDESAKGPSEARAAEMALEYQIVGVVNETYGPTYPWSLTDHNAESLKKSRLVPNPVCRLTYLPAHEVTRENLDALSVLPCEQAGLPERSVGRVLAA